MRYKLCPLYRGFSVLDLAEDQTDINFFSILLRYVLGFQVLSGIGGGVVGDGWWTQSRKSQCTHSL